MNIVECYTYNCIYWKCGKGGPAVIEGLAWEPVEAGAVRTFNDKKMEASRGKRERV